MREIKRKCKEIQSIINFLDSKKNELEEELVKIREECPHIHVVPKETNLFQLKVCSECGLITQRTPKT